MRVKSVKCAIAKRGRVKKMLKKLLVPRIDTIVMGLTPMIILSNGNVLLGEDALAYRREHHA